MRKVSYDKNRKNPTLGEKYYSDWIGFGHVLLKNLPAGEYEIYIQYAWPADTPSSPNKLVKDYTVRVYAQEQVIIYDSQKRQSVTTGHDYTFWPEVLK